MGNINKVNLENIMTNTIIISHHKQSYILSAEKLLSREKPGSINKNDEEISTNKCNILNKSLRPSIKKPKKKKTNFPQLPQRLLRKKLHLKII